MRIETKRRRLLLSLEVTVLLLLLLSLEVTVLTIVVLLPAEVDDLELAGCGEREGDVSQ